MRAQRLAAFVSLVLLATLVSPVAAQQQPGGVAADGYIVVLNDGVTRPADVAAEMSRAHDFEVGFIYQHAFKGFAAQIPAERVAAVERDPRVAWVEADRLFTINADPDYETGVNRVESDRNTTFGAKGADGATTAVIAVLDTGVTSDDVNVVRRFDCSGGGPFKSSCTEGSGQDGHGHGTHVAGTAAAKKNGTGVIGVAPGAPVWSIKVLSDTGSGYTSWIAAGIDLTAANSGTVAVANMSLGGSGSDDGNCGNSNNDAMHKAICKAVNNGVVYVVAAGNSADDAANHVPAAYDEVITVSAVADFNGKGGGGAAATCRSDVDDTFADFSNYGADVDIAAPGVCITSTWYDGTLNTISGTSMASPHVAGVAAMWIANNHKPDSAAGTVLVRDGLTGAGFAQTDLACSFTGDPDPWAEPLVNADAVNVGGTGATCDTAGTGGGDTNTAPVATDDAASTTEGVAVTVNVLANDDDADGDVLSVTNLTAATNGTVTLNHDQTVTYQPNTGFIGTDSFEYTANDGLVDSNVAKVTITVNSTSSGGSTTMSIGDMTGSNSDQGSRWSAFVTITIVDGDGVAVNGASVSGAWTYNGTSVADGCTTLSNGQCTVDLTQILKRVGSVTFTADNVDDGGAHTWDGTPQSETVFKP